jgi:PhoPQ-activated pathogenicity-related protein
MRLDCWYAGLFRSFPPRRRSSVARNRERRFSSQRRRWGVVSARARIEVLEDRALLNGTPGGPTPGGNSTLPTLTPSQITALDTYVAAPDSSYQFALNSTLTGTGYTDYVINMVSQTWTPSPGDSQVWQHWLQIIVPTTVSTHTAVLNISGGTNSSTAPTSPDAQSLATATTLNAITVFLPTVPNEPVTFPAQGETTPLTEDQIVAYTFEQFLDGNGQDWPLLLPMVKSAVRAMDTTQSFVSSQSGGTLSVDNFIVTGASKRGWTTWLTPAVDTRVVAIVPYVFDGLNLADQVESQLDTYVGVTQDTVNGDSTAVQDYTGDGVFNFFGTTQMSSLLSIVDPYAYIGRSTYNIPKYLIDSTGDQFFVPGAQFYFSNLPGENYLRYIPNTDHSLDTDAVTGGIDFEKALLDGAALPQFTWNVGDSGTTITLNSATTPSSVTMWQATNTTNRDFRLETFGANWTSSTLTDQGGGTYVAQVTPPTTGATDFFIQMQYTVDGMTLTFTTQISTVPLLTPTVVVSDSTGDYNGNPFAATATATGLAGLPVEGTFTYDYYTGVNPIGTPFTTAPTNAGTYTVVASFTTSDPDYVDGQSDPVVFTIEQPEPVISISDNGGSYNDTSFPATATIAGVVTGVDNTPGSSLEGVPLTVVYYAGPNPIGTPLAGPPTQAGQYTAQAVFAGSQDYQASNSVVARFTIAKDSPVVTLTDAGGPYNDTPYPATGTIAGVVTGVDDTPGGSLEGVPLTLTYYANGSTTPLSGAPTTAGAYNVVAAFNGSQDYLGAGKQIFFQIAHDTPVLTVTDSGGPYNDAPYPATATIAGVISGVDNTPGSSLEGVPITITYYANGSTTPLSGAPTTAGSYNLVASFNGSQDYLDTAKQIFFQITADTPVISLSDAGGTYNANPFPATATIAGVVSGVDNTPGSSLEGVPLSLSYFPDTTITGTPLSGAPTNAGQYTALASFAGSTDYATFSQSVTFQIGQATPTVVVSDAGGNFTGNPFPASATATGVGGATLSGTFGFTYYVGSTVNGNGTSTAPSAPGTYTAVAAFTSSDANYVTGPTNSLPVVFTINQSNSPPSIIAPATASVAENTALVFSSGNGNAISITDASAGSSVEQLTLTVTNGTLRLAATTGLTITSGSNNSASMTVTGTLANLNAALNGLQFTPTTGYSGPASLAVTFKDLGNSQSASATVAITVVAPPVTVKLLTFLPIVVPGEPVPFIISARDTIPGAQFGPFKINISFGDGNAATFSAGILPILVNHIYRQDGTCTVTVTATDQFGNTSLPATVVIRVISLRIGFNPFNPNQTALIIGETPGNSYSFGAAANGGIAVTIDGVSQGVFNVSGPVIVLGQQGKQLANQSYGFSNQGLLVETPTVGSLESNLDSEALQWAGLSAATEILNE